MSVWDEIDALKKTLPETPKQRRERETQETLAEWRAWFKAQGWDEVEDIEAELGRPSLDTPGAQEGRAVSYPMDWRRR